LKSKLLLLNLFLSSAFLAKGSLFPTGTIPDGNPVGVTFAGTYDQAAIGATVSGFTATWNCPAASTGIYILI